MTIAIDGTSPAAVTGTGTAALTTASFTPPANSLIVAVVNTGNSTGSGVQDGTMTDSLSGAWTVDKTANVSGAGMVSIVRRTTVTAASATTCTWTPSGATGKGAQIKVFVLTGQHASPVGASGSGTAGTTAGVSVTTTDAASILLGAVTYTVSGIALTINGISLNDLATNDATNGETYGSFHALVTATGAQTFGYTNSSLTQVKIAAVEYLPAATAATVHNYGFVTNNLRPHIFSPGLAR